MFSSISTAAKTLWDAISTPETRIGQDTIDKLVIAYCATQFLEGKEEMDASALAIVMSTTLAHTAINRLSKCSKASLRQWVFEVVSTGALSHFCGVNAKAILWFNTASSIFFTDIDSDKAIEPVYIPPAYLDHF